MARSPGAAAGLLLLAAAPAAAADFAVPHAAELPPSVPDGGYGGLGYARGFGAGYRRDADSPVDAVTALITRVGLDASQFALSTIPPTADGLDTMQLGSAGGKVTLKGSGGVALASALNWYLSASPAPAPLGPLRPPLVVTPAAPVCR